MRALALLLAAASFAGPALAQIRPPRTNPAERQVQELNRSIDRQQRELRDQQRNQFETNQLRQELSRERNTPDLSRQFQPGRLCPPGQLRC